MPAFSEISGEWKATRSSRNDRPTTPRTKSGKRPFMYSLWSSSAAVTPPILAVTPLRPSSWGTVSSRSRLTRSSVSWSCGELFGITVIRAASPAELTRGFVTKATSESSRTLWANESTAALSLGLDMSAAITIGPLVPGPKPSVLRS